MFRTKIEGMTHALSTCFWFDGKAKEAFYFIKKSLEL